ncbi:MAG: sigma-70 family RNA polymerase sigma factor [Phycisphaerales bacterium]|nr:sigma-70 family RNA polymerase sigma factor [Phycisphaerales bacterium]
MPGAVELTDAIVEAGVAGSRPALRELIHALAPQIRLMVAARLHNVRDRFNAVDEVAQRVLLALLDSLPRLERRTVGGLKCYVSAIAARKAADYICMRRESKGRADTVSLDPWRAAGVDDEMMDFVLSASDTTPGRAAEKSEQVQRMLAALDVMRPQYREVITLAFYDQLSVSDIGERLGISRPAASMLLMRAVNALRAQLRESQSGESNAGPG